MPNLGLEKSCRILDGNVKKMDHEYCKSSSGQRTDEHKVRFVSHAFNYCGITIMGVVVGPARFAETTRELVADTMSKPREMKL